MSDELSKAWVVIAYNGYRDEGVPVAVVLSEDDAEAAGAVGPVDVYRPGELPEIRTVYYRTMFVADADEHKSQSEVDERPWAKSMYDVPLGVPVVDYFPWDDGYEKHGVPVQTRMGKGQRSFKQHYQTVRDGEVVKQWSNYTPVDGTEIAVFGTDKELVEAEIERLCREHGIDDE